MNLKSFSSIYFLGIGGIGMSALVRYFAQGDRALGGYDLTLSEITKSLEDLGVTITYKEDIGVLEESFLNSENCLVVHTPAVPKSNVLYRYFVENGYPMVKRAALLGMLTQDTFCYAVAGTHGKTTTSSILSHLLHQSKVPFTAFLGGIANNFKSNYFSSGLETTVVEADEFDRSFLHLKPDVACITSTDADHLDIYENAATLENSFRDFAHLVTDSKRVLVKSGLPIQGGLRYGFESDCDYRPFNINIQGFKTRFDLQTPSGCFCNLELNMPGTHNLMNAVAAFAMAHLQGLSGDILGKALGSFSGVSRRFSIEINKKSCVYVDDYAHHPTAIRGVWEALESSLPGREKLVVFQPHLYSRTRDFVDEFAKSLSLFSSVLLLPIYPARELPIAGVDSEWLLGKITSIDKALVHRDALIEEVKKRSMPVVVTLGAGDIGNEVNKLREALC